MKALQQPIYMCVFDTGVGGNLTTATSSPRRSGGFAGWYAPLSRALCRLHRLKKHRADGALTRSCRESALSPGGWTKKFGLTIWQRLRACLRRDFRGVATVQIRRESQGSQYQHGRLSGVCFLRLVNLEMGSRGASKRGLMSNAKPATAFQHELRHFGNSDGLGRGERRGGGWKIIHIQV